MVISAILRGRKDKDGRLTLTIRMNSGKVRRFRAMPLKLHPDNFKNGMVINHPQAATLNKKIAQWIREAELSVALKPINKFPDADFKLYAYNCLRQWDKTKKQSTLTQIKGEVDRFEKFAGQVKLSRITISLLNEYKTHLLKTRTTNTAWKTFKCLKVIIGKAVREKVIEENPFDMFENVKYSNPKKEWLNNEEIERINNYVQRNDTPKRIAFIGNWFLIGCYTGLRYSDMNNFNARHHIKNGRLTLYTTKTNEVVSLPLEKIKHLFDRVGNKPLDITNQKYNEYLKVLAGAVGIPTMSAHLSRHTFAVRCASSGLSPEVTAKLMGITNLKTVAVYYKLTSNRIDDEYSKLF
jgi:site-specific recombinase XerD